MNNKPIESRNPTTQLSEFDLHVHGERAGWHVRWTGSRQEVDQWAGNSTVDIVCPEYNNAINEALA